MKKVKIYNKETLIVYLINELEQGSWEVITHLDDKGCWLGHVEIKISNESSIEDSRNYYKELVIGIDN